MTDAARGVVQKLWSYCNVLRDDGLSYPDYIEQLTYLLFLKMMDEEREDLGIQDALSAPARRVWRSLVEADQDQLLDVYQAALVRLADTGGMLNVIFSGARNKIRDPAKLRLLIVDLIGGHDWSALGIDVKGAAYEGLLEKNAQDTKSGAGQYFTPRPLIDAIVACVDPRPGEVVYDPACGTGGFLISALQHLRREHSSTMTAEDLRFLKVRAIRGAELVPEVTRLAAMNLLLHGVGPENGDEEVPVVTRDSLAAPTVRKYDVILTNPPFGTRSSVRAPGLGAPAGNGKAGGEWVFTNNKELNFLQQVMSSLKDDGRAAVVVPDGVLASGGAAIAVRLRLLERFNLHTILRLPPGIFYAQGVNANVLFFDAPESSSNRDDGLWVYDLRTDMRFSLTGRRLAESDLSEFVALYLARVGLQSDKHRGRAEPHGRWRRFERQEVLQQAEARLDLSWVSASASAAPELASDLLAEIVADLSSALDLAERLMQD